MKPDKTYLAFIMVWRPKKSQKMLSKDASLLNPLTSQTFHGTGIFPYINHKKQPNVGKYPYMDPMGIVL